MHGGPGQLDYMGLFNATALDTNLYFLHRGIIQPKSGIGAHFHNQCEEMFVIFDGEAQFTIDGRTSRAEGTRGRARPHGALARDLQPHRQAGAVDEHQRVGAQGRLRRVRSRRRPRRCAARSDPDVHDDAARPGAAAAGRRADRGKGTVQYRRALPPSVFLGPWAYVDHLVLAPGSATAPQAHQEIGEFYYVMNGEGTVKVGAETAPIRSGDAVPIQLNETKSFENTGTAPLELLVVGIVRDANRKFDVVAPPARGGRGN